MVRVSPVNRKLRDRAERLVVRIAGVDRARAAELLVAGGDDVRVAVLMQKKRIDAATARIVLITAGGSLRSALQ